MKISLDFNDNKPSIEISRSAAARFCSMLLETLNEDAKPFAITLRFTPDDKLQKNSEFLEETK